MAVGPDRGRRYTGQRAIDWYRSGERCRLSPDDAFVRCVRESYHLATGRELPVRGVNVVGSAADLVGIGGIPAVYHGVNQTTAHSDDEYLSATDLVRAARVYAAVARSYLGEQW